MAIYSNDQIAAGHDNAAGLESIEDIIPSGDIAFFPVAFFADYSPGSRRIRQDGTIYFAGFPRLRWTFNKLTRAQYAYLRDTYCNGGYSGLVTVRSRTEEDDTWANYNATMNLPTPDELNFTLESYSEFVVTFTRLVAL